MFNRLISIDGTRIRWLRLHAASNAGFARNCNAVVMTICISMNLLQCKPLLNTDCLRLICIAVSRKIKSFGLLIDISGFLSMICQINYQLWSDCCNDNRKVTQKIGYMPPSCHEIECFAKFNLAFTSIWIVKSYKARVACWFLQFDGTRIRWL